MIYLKDKVSACINASGRMTKLGVSTQSKGVLEAMHYGSSQYFLMDQFYKDAGQAIAQLLDAPDVVVTSCASAGIAMSVAAILCKNHPEYIRNVEDLKNAVIPKEIVIPKGHNVDFGAPVQTMIELGGGVVVEAGYGNQCSPYDLELCINDNTAALMYVKSSHCVQKEMLSLEAMISLGQKYTLPVILDCAAEIDFVSFTQMGIDYIIYSGSKALMAPTSGFVIVQSQEVGDNLRKQYYGSGRSMKIGKENIFGLVQAVYEYMNDVSELHVSYDDLDPFIEEINKINGLSATKGQDESGREIYRAKVHINEQELKISVNDFIKKLEQGSPPIFTRNYEKHLGIIAFDPRPLQSKEDLNVILNRLKEVASHVELL